MTKPNSVDAASLHPIVPRVFELMESQNGTKAFGSVGDISISIERIHDPYANCKSFSDVCQVFFDEDPEMRKFFGSDKDGK